MLIGEKHWMDRNGKIYPTNGSSHLEWASRYLGISNSLTGRYIEETMFNTGWIRLNKKNNELAFEYKPGKYPSNKQLKVMTDICIEDSLYLHDDVEQSDINLDGSKFLNVMDELSYGDYFSDSIPADVKPAPLMISVESNRSIKLKKLMPKL